MTTMPAARFSPADLAEPIVLAPLAGGPSTPALAAAVAGAGGLGFLAAGYQRARAVVEDLAAARALADGPLGLNLFVPGDGAPARPEAVERYAERLREEARRQDAPLGAPRHDDDDWDAKLTLALAARPQVVSFTFGCPPAATIERLRAAGIAVWVTVTSAPEARAASDAGADALVVQGTEAGGHRGSFDDDAPGDVGLLALLQLVRAQTDLPLVGAGGVMDGRGVAAVLAAGAQAAQLGSAFLRAPEAGTSAPHRDALAAGGTTALTRAFSGRTARGIVNRFLREHDAAAPSAYPEIHHLTAPLRAAARARGDADAINLWAGQAHALGEAVPAAELTRRLGAGARAALRDAARRAGA